jgi:hypothetical protein
MSTKIYYAYRMPVQTFIDSFLPAFRKHVFKQAVSFIKKNLIEDNEPTVELLKSIFVRMAEASKSKLRRYECIDCSLNVWIYKNKVYTILYGEPFLWRKFKPPAKVEDYCYWNNTDEPENVTRRQWNERGKTWEKVCLADGCWDTGRMVHEIINASTKLGLVEVGTPILGVDGAWGAIAFYEKELLAKAIQFDGGQEVLYGGNFVYNVEAMKHFSDNPNSKYRYKITFGGVGWSVRDSMDQVLSKSTGGFEYESMPSSRPDGWLKDTRFETVEEAFAFLEEYKQKTLKRAEEKKMLLWHPDKDKRVPYKWPEHD